MAFLNPIVAFSTIYGIRVFKTRVPRGFFLTLDPSAYKSIFNNSSVLDTRDVSFQHCFKSWQLTKFFYIYCYLERVFPLLGFVIVTATPLKLKTLKHRRMITQSRCGKLSSTKITLITLTSSSRNPYIFSSLTLHFLILH